MKRKIPSANFSLHGFLLPLFFLLLGSCENSPSRPVSDACRYEKGQYQMCYGSCMASSVGTTLQVMAKCGNQCRAYIPRSC